MSRLAVLVVLLLVACSVATPPTATPEQDAEPAIAPPAPEPLTTSEREYREAGESLNSKRSPDVAWADGSNWRDGVSHELPSLPIAPSARILDGMTCIQWEALNIAVFPDGYDILDWYRRTTPTRLATSGSRTWQRRSGALTPTWRG